MCLDKLFTNIKWIALVFSLSFLVGCAAPANYSQMTVGINEFNRTFPKPNPKMANNVALQQLTGGKQTNPLWTSQVDNEGFSKALGDSLANAGYLSVNQTPARFQLTVAFKELKQPFAGLDLKVICKAHYSLYDTKNQKLVFDKTLTTPYTATFSSALLAGERLKLANEGAVKENIKHFLQEIHLVKTKE